MALDVVAEGDTQVVRDPSGAVQSEVVTWWDGWQQWGHSVTTVQDVLKDVLGSPIRCCCGRGDLEGSATVW